LEEHLRSFVEDTLGARVEQSAPLGSGASRATWLLTGSDGRECVLRADTGDGPMAGTELTLAREAAVYAALQEHPVLIPRLLGIAPRGEALLIERAPGAEELHALAPEARVEVMDRYVDALAALHGVDPAALPLPGFARPAAENPARAELALWRGVYEKRVTRAAPLARFCFAWLERHAPREAERIALCHGDVGPGNFLHESGRVTTLLDWEFAHLGDPLDDLAWLSFRGHHLHDGIGDFSAQLRRWSALTGLRVVPERLAWYRALVMLRMLVACHAALDSGAASLDRSVYFSIGALLAALLPRALAELAGIELEPPAPAAPGDRTEATEIFASVQADLASTLIPALPGPARRRASGLALLLLHLEASDRLAPAVREAEREAAAELLGRTPAPGKLDEAVDAALQTDSEGNDARWIRFFLDAGARRIALWPFLIPLASKPLLRLTGPGAAGTDGHARG
jgi:aminoglycoside phosphotransferase (APT) family kinase protein